MNIPLELKRPKAKSSVIMSRFSRNGISLKLYTGKSLKTANWSKSKSELLSGEANYEIINKYLETWKRELSTIIENLEAEKTRLDNEEIQELIDKAMNRNVPKKTIANPDENENEKEIIVRDFTSFMQWYIKKKKAKAREIQKLQQTRKLIIVGFNLITKKSLAEWEALSIKQKSRATLQPDFSLSFRKINLKFIEDFREYLGKAQYVVKINEKEVWKNYKINYIDKQIKGLKQFIKAAIDPGKYVQSFSWNSIPTEEIEVDSVITDFDEIQQLYDTKLTDPIEKKVRDKYIVNCFLGMRYGDFNRLDNHVFKTKTIKGKKYTVYSGRDQKTDSNIEFAIHPIAEAILEEYNFDLPKISAQVFNQVIKTVTFKAGLSGLVRIREVRGNEKIFLDIPKNKLIGSHTMRRSFCTNFYVEGVPIQAIMSISGHSTEEEFLKYIKKKGVRVEVVAEQILAIKGINHLKVA